MVKTNELKKEYIYFLQVAFASWVYIGSHDTSLNLLNWSAIDRAARFIIYLVTINISEEILKWSYRALQTGSLDAAPILKQWITRLVLLTGSAAVLVLSNKRIFDEDYLFVTIASLLVRYPEKTMEQGSRASPAISYGSGMACSFFEGYLRIVVPPDENDFTGFQGSIRNYESREGVRFPVRQLFLVITKSLHCPPNLAYFNKEHRPDLPSFEACKSLEDVTRNVAGVQRRVYRNSAYQLRRPAAAPPLYVAMECATPLHTLHKVVTNKVLYDELLHADPDEIRSDFCDMLEKILNKSPDCRGKCQLVYYDDTDPEQNLADIVLQRIRELEPNFEELILDVQHRKY